MSGVELGLAVLATADICLRYGKSLVDKYRTFKGAKSEIDDKIISLEIFEKKTECQIKFLKSIWSTLPSEYQEIVGITYPTLQKKLQIADQAVGRIISKHPPEKASSLAWSKRFLYTVYFKEVLEKTISDVNEWQRIFDPTWFLVVRVPGQVVDTGLRHYAGTSTTLSLSYRLRNSLTNEEASEEKGIYLPYVNFPSSQRSAIKFSDASLVTRPGKASIIIDSVEFQESNTSGLPKDIRYLAQKLRNIDPLIFQILKCEGVMKVKDVSKQIIHFDFVLRVPRDMGKPQSLRELLVTTSCQTYPLSDRIRIANHLASSISFVHTYKIVHKDVRPETILVLSDRESKLGSLFLTGFKTFRMVDEQSMRAGDNDWARNIYRHPERQGLHPEEDYRMLHDIYSLGVCLLEIGLWESLVQYKPTARLEMQPNNLLQMDGVITPNLSSKALFMRLAEKELPGKMGNLYAQVVLTCLDYCDEEENHGAITEGVRYIERPLLRSITLPTLHR
ncbi:hypothetical protein MYU51_010389 [Penicillium brevicompactum]